MKNQISALIDGELGRDEAERCLQRLKQDSELREVWETHHLIGDALRGQLGYQLGEAFSERLRAEPTVLAPKARQDALRNTRWYALSAAAGVAAVAVAAWVALPQIRTEQVGPMASSLQAAPAQQIEVPAAVGVGDYLLAHQRFSPSSSMQGVAPYVRTVSEERKGAAR